LSSSAEAATVREEVAKSKEPELLSMANELLVKLHEKQMDLSLLDSSTLPPLKALVAMVPDGRKGLSANPKKVELVARVKELLGGAGAPKFEHVRKQLAEKQPVNVVPLPTAAAAQPQLMPPAS